MDHIPILYDLYGNIWDINYIITWKFLAGHSAMGKQT